MQYKLFWWESSVLCVHYWRNKIDDFTIMKKCSQNFASPGYLDQNWNKLVFSLEQQCWSNRQYSRLECLKLSGIHESLKHSELEDIAVKF